MGKLVAAGLFVKRQTKESGFSHYSGSWEELEDLVKAAMNDPLKVHPGYKDGVVLVDLTSNKFYSSIVRIDDSVKISASFAARRIGEAPFIRLATKAKKQEAKYVTVVLYRADVLEENNERETDAEWEIVAIKARVSEEEDPMDPYTMARNFLHLKGGTKGDFTAEQFAKSIVYWNNHVMSMGKKSLLNKFMSLFKKDN